MIEAAIPQIPLGARCASPSTMLAGPASSFTPVTAKPRQEKVQKQE